MKSSVVITILLLSLTKLLPAQIVDIKVFNTSHQDSDLVHGLILNRITPEFSIHDSSSKAYFLGYSINKGKSNLSELYKTFRKEASELGANTYRIDTIYYSRDTTFIGINVFKLTETELDSNYQYYPTNMVYMFGDLDVNKKAKSIKFNGQKMFLPPLKKIAYQNEVGKEAVFSIGGFTGAKTWIKGKEGRLAEHLSLSGFTAGPSLTPYGGVGVNFNTGRFYPVEFNLGDFLVQIIKTIEPPKSLK